jgi:CheY-like chemotaxis protein
VGSTAQQRHLLLIADDGGSEGVLLRAAMSRRGLHWEVEQVADGIELMERLARAPRPDVLLLDLRMPRLDGLDALAAVRADARLRGTPTALWSGLITEGDRLRAAELGADLVAVKPTGLDALTAFIEELTALADAGRGGA